MKNLALIFLLFANLSLAQEKFYEILPSSTDTAINGSNDPHYIYLNSSVLALHKLLLFFPGTNASAADYTLLLKKAADLGYHVIGLDYENDQSINLEVCPQTQDPTCHRRARNEIWLGEDSHPNLNVNPDNSVVNRVHKLLIYLKNNYPSDQWDQYFNLDNSVDWTKITTVGHSQGAGHAAFASLFYPVEKIIMFSWIDWLYPGINADWITFPKKVQPGAFLGFIHTGDAAIYSGIPTTWHNIGMDLYGNIINIDNEQPPYNNTHSLISSFLLPGNPSQTVYHNATCVDWETPISPSTNRPYFESVWEYLLTAPPSGTPINPVKISPDGSSYIDPEILSSENKLGYQTGTGEVYLANLNPNTGLFIQSEGKDYLINTNCTPLAASFNGPEFGVDQEGWSVFYNKNINGFAQVWRAVLTGDSIINTPLTAGNIGRFSIQPSKFSQSPHTKLFYSKGSSFNSGAITVMEENNPALETEIDKLDTGVRWINGTSKMAYIKQTGPASGQIAIYDAANHTEIVITDDSDSKSYAYGWFAPEYQDYLVFCITDNNKISIYKNNGAAFWDKIITLDPPAEAGPYHYFGSPEPFVVGNKSYISLVLKVTPATSSYVNAQVWVLGIEADAVNRFQQRCDGGGEARRTDPEFYIAENKVFIYYNQLSTTNIFEIWRFETDIPLSPTSATKQSDMMSNTIRLYPNPCQDHLNILFQNPFEDFSVEIISNSGKTMGNYKNAYTIGTEMLPAGVYYLKIMSNQHIIIKKINVSRK